MRAPADKEPALRVTCWGTRGSIPAPGPETVRFGGNTSCVEVRAPGCRLIFDAGTGIRALSGALAAEGRPLDAHLFVSHYHWDHIQGFPFLAQLYEPATRLRVHGPKAGEVPVDEALEGQMAPLYFPVPLQSIAANVDFVTADGSPWRGGGDVCVDAFRVQHPGVTYGYRVSAGGATAVYIPDNELGDAPDADWYAGLVEFVRGADLLLHDAMLTDAEYAPRQGWGHSTFAQAVRLAQEAGVRRLALFHHAPDRSDAELEAIAGALRADLAARGSALELSIAAEREEVAISPGGA